MNKSLQPTLRGERIRLRPVERTDLDTLYEHLNDLTNRGPWFPMRPKSQATFFRAFEETGFWGSDEGMLLMTDGQQILGEIEYYPIASYLTGFELSYLVFGSGDRGRGHATEGVKLLGDHLFATRPIQRIQLAIHPDNVASLRVAEKAGYSREGAMRKCWFNGGEFHDLEIWARLRS